MCSAPFSLMRSQQPLHHWTAWLIYLLNVSICLYLAGLLIFSTTYPQSPALWDIKTKHVLMCSLLPNITHPASGPRQVQNNGGIMTGKGTKKNIMSLPSATAWQCGIWWNSPGGNKPNCSQSNTFNHKVHPLIAHILYISYIYIYIYTYIYTHTHTQADPRIRGFSTRGLPRPEKKLGKLRK
jgi:hypothetical protein